MGQTALRLTLALNPQNPPPPRPTAAQARADLAVLGERADGEHPDDEYPDDEYPDDDDADRPPGAGIDRVLVDAGGLRIAHPEATLAELAAMCEPSVSQDTFAGRLRRLRILADRRRGETGPGDSSR